MKKLIDDERIILRICDLYYNQGKRQSAISEEMGLSRPTISRMLSIAREAGIVKIIISDLHGRNYYKLERELEEKYNLKEVIIADTKAEGFEQKEELGKAAAAFLERIIREGNIIGVSMGSTLSHIAKFANSAVYYRKLAFIPLIGGVGQVETELHANHIVETMAKCFGGRGVMFHAPAMVSRHETKEALLKEESIKKLFEKIDRLDIAVLGIGSVAQGSTIIQAGYYDLDLMYELAEKGVVGDICLSFYDSNGDTQRFEINQNVIGMDLNKLKSVPYSIGVAGGAVKVNAIYGALKGKFINVLVTDVECASMLLSLQ